MNYFSIHFNISCGHLRWLFQKRSLKKNSWPHKLPTREKQEYGLARVILFQRDLLADTVIKKSHVLCCPIMGSNVFRFRIFIFTYFHFYSRKHFKVFSVNEHWNFAKIIRWRCIHKVKIHTTSEKNWLPLCWSFSQTGDENKL